MKVNDAVSGVILIVFAIIMMAYASGFPSTQPDRPGPALFPITLGIFFVLCGAVLVIKGLGSRAPWLQAQEWMRNRESLLNAAGVLTAIIAYQFLSDFIGFLPLAVLMMFLLMKLLKVRTLTALLSSVVCALIIHTLFVKVLLVPLPWGLLEPIAW